MKNVFNNYVKETLRLATCSVVALSLYFFLFEMARGFSIG